MNIIVWLVMRERGKKCTRIRVLPDVKLLLCPLMWHFFHGRSAAVAKI